MQIEGGQRQEYLCTTDHYILVVMAVMVLASLLFLSNSCFSSFSNQSSQVKAPSVHNFPCLKRCLAHYLEEVLPGLMESSTIALDRRSPDISKKVLAGLAKICIA